MTRPAPFLAAVAASVLAVAAVVVAQQDPQGGPQPPLGVQVKVRYQIGDGSTLATATLVGLTDEWLHLNGTQGPFWVNRKHVVAIHHNR